MTLARKELTRRVDAVELYIDECSEPGPKRSGAMQTLARLREERDTMDRDQADTIAAVVKFAKELRDLTPERLGVTSDDTRDSVVSKTTRLLERERVAAELLRLLEEAGVDIHV